MRQHVVFAPSDSERTSLCGNLTTTADERCTLVSTAPAGNFGRKCEPRSCAGKVGATQASDCINWMASCRYLGNGFCVDSSLTCSYSPTGLDNTTKKVICENVNNGASPNPTKCTFNNDALTCRLMTCADIAMAAN